MTESRRVKSGWSGPGPGLAILRMTLILSLFLCFKSVFAQNAGELERRVRSILESYGQESENWGILVRSLEHGDDLLSFNATRRYMPASNLKLLVTAAALDGLGPDFSYRTTVMATGDFSRQDSLLEGELIIRGSGDPTISDRFYPGVTAIWDSLAQQVASTGIRHVTGSLVADNTLFKAPFLGDGWSWEDLNWWYATAVSALSYNDNCIDVEVFPSQRVGEAPEVRIKPQGSEIRMLNRALTVASRAQDRLVISRNTPGGEISLGGGIYRGSLGFIEYVAVENPPRFAANAFADALARRGIRVDGTVKILNAPQDSAAYLDQSPLIVAQHLSVPLSKVIWVTNKRSHNFYAEQLLFTLGAYLGSEGSFKQGVEIEKRFLSKLGVDTRGLRIQDGSGLSRLNLVTPEMFVSLLSFMDKHPAREHYISSLAVAGKDNGVRLMRNTAADGKLFAKTGYISAVMALSGYTETADGERVAFSILGNNWLIPRERARRIIRDICVAIAESRRQTPDEEKAG
jgi:D-alanyl-D-alanine carboxypeptidase/D-alanyl-D-alanine-endopeptidase (penicillin-binding protein 4)